ncbi:hypothetical protein NUACC21_53010 [Scytonema sp. NUACC21]
MNHSDLLPEQLDDRPTQQTINFEYGILETETQVVVQQCTNEIKTLMRRNSQDIIAIGQKLIEVKQHLGHGNFRNWLKFEFSWSVSAATKFMQVAEQFKCVNFTYLKIAASTLYLIAAPSTPKEARAEVLKRASDGENISYAKAKAILSQYKKTKKGAVELKTTLLKPDKPVYVIKPTRYETSAVSTQEDLTEKEAQTEETQLLSLHKSLSSFAFEDRLIATTIQDIPENTTQLPTSIKNQVTISLATSDAEIVEMAISIKNFTPEQLALVIIKAANDGLSEYQLSAIITASQQALNTRR